MAQLLVRDSYRALPVYVVTLGSRQPEMSEKLRELQQGLTEGGVDLFRRQVRKLGINALKALASELELSVEGSRLKEEFASRLCAKIEVQESVTRLRCVVQSGGTKGLWTQLKALKVEDLRVIAQEIGLPSSGVRDAVMKRLFDDISAQEAGTTGRPLPSSSSRRPELPEAGNDEQPPRRGCITEGVSVDLVGAVVWIGVLLSCGLGTDWYRDISIDCCADTWLLNFSVSVGKVRFMSYVMLLQEPACTTISEPMRWQEHGDAGGNISAQVEELRMDASSKGRTPAVISHSP